MARIITEEELNKIKQTPFTQLLPKEQKRISIEMIQKGIQTLNTTGNSPQKFYEFITHPACFEIMYHSKFVDYLKDFLNEQLNDSSLTKPQLDKLMSLCYNFCSLISQYRYGNAELNNEITIAGLAVLVSHKKSPFAAKTIVHARINNYLASLYLQRFVLLRISNFIEPKEIKV